MKIGHGLDELFAKHNILLNKTERIYAQSLVERDYNLENTTPFCLVVDGYLELREKAWTKIVKGVATYLQSNYPLPLEELYNFRTKWSKAAVFGPTNFLNNCACVAPNLYVSVNFTSLHSLWFVQDLFELYKVDLSNCYLLIHRSPYAEPIEVQNYIIDVVKESFTNYLISERDKKPEIAQKIVKNIEYLNKILEKVSRSYFNFFLIDSPITLSNLKSRLLIDHGKYVAWSEKQLASARNCLDYYTDFFREIGKVMSLGNRHLSSINANGKIVEFESVLDE